MQFNYLSNSHFSNLSSSGSKPSRSTSKLNMALVLALSVALATTGCASSWLSVALADLPVLTQMAINIAGIVTTLQSGKQLDPAEAAAIQNLSAEATKDLNLLQTLYAEYKASPNLTTLQKIDDAITAINQNLPASAISAYYGFSAGGAHICGRRFNSDDGLQLCIPHASKQAWRRPKNLADGHTHRPRQRLKTAMERSSMQGQQQ